MSDLTQLNTQQVGKCGELLVQYELLKNGVESAPMTTDYGVDLVALRAGTLKPVTIQVKASTHHLGEASSKWLTWSMPSECKAEYVAVADVERDKGWFFSKKEFEYKAIGTKEGCWLWRYVPKYEYKSPPTHLTEEHYKEYEIDPVVHRVFP